MRKIHISNAIIMATLVSAVLYLHIQNTNTYIAHITTPSPAIWTPTPDEEKEQLKREIQVLRENNKRLKWYWDNFHIPIQAEYMKARGK